MPGSDAILATLGETARRFIALGVAWHVAVAIALIAAAFVGRSPSRKTATALMSLPFASVSVLAWVMASPFNGLVFAVLALLALVISTRCPAEPLQRPEPWARVAGSVLVGFAWVYPHFLEERSPVSYLFASPMGLIPCPTLALVLGLTLLGAGLAGLRWTIVLAAAGTFYAVFGTLRLGVALDWVLLAGVIALVFQQARAARAHTLASAR